jgi:hypothetical protein
MLLPALWDVRSYTAAVVRFKILTAARMKITAFWDVAPCSLTSETSVYFHETTQRYIPQRRHLRCWCYSSKRTAYYLFHFFSCLIMFPTNWLTRLLTHSVYWLTYPDSLNGCQNSIAFVCRLHISEVRGFTRPQKSHFFVTSTRKNRYDLKRINWSISQLHNAPKVMVKWLAFLPRIREFRLHISAKIPAILRISWFSHSLRGYAGIVA